MALPGAPTSPQTRNKASSTKGSRDEDMARWDMCRNRGDLASVVQNHVQPIRCPRLRTACDGYRQPICLHNTGDETVSNIAPQRRWICESANKSLSMDKGVMARISEGGCTALLKVSKRRRASAATRIAASSRTRRRVSEG